MVKVSVTVGTDEKRILVKNSAVPSKVKSLTLNRTVTCDKLTL